jgi:hypothetical protein
MLRRTFIKAMVALTAVPVIGPKLIKPYTDDKGWTGQTTITQSVSAGSDATGDYLLVENLVLNFRGSELVDTKVAKPKKIYHVKSFMESDTITVNAEIDEEFQAPTLLENYVDKSKRN